MGLDYFGFYFDSENELSRTEEKRKLSNRIDSLQAWIKDSPSDTRRMQPTTLYQGRISRTKNTTSPSPDCNPQLLQHVSKIIIRDNEILAILPIEGQNRKGTAFRATIAPRSDQDCAPDQSRCISPFNGSLGTNHEVTSMRTIQASYSCSESVSQYFFANGGDSVSLEDHAMKTLSLLRNSCHPCSKTRAAVHRDKLIAYTRCNERFSRVSAKAHLTSSKVPRISTPSHSTNI